MYRVHAATVQETDINRKQVHTNRYVHIGNKRNVSFHGTSYTNMQLSYTDDDVSSSYSDEDAYDDDPKHPRPHNTLLVLCTEPMQQLAHLTSLFNDRDFYCTSLPKHTDKARLDFCIRQAVVDARGGDGGGVVCLVFCGHGQAATDGDMHGSMVLQPRRQKKQYITHSDLRLMLVGFKGTFILILGSCSSGECIPLPYNTGSTNHQGSIVEMQCKFMVVVSCDQDKTTTAWNVDRVLEAFSHCVEVGVQYMDVDRELRRYWKRITTHAPAPRCVGNWMFREQLLSPATELVRPYACVFSSFCIHCIVHYVRFLFCRLSRCFTKLRSADASTQT